jgi:hypothetical protein
MIMVNDEYVRTWKEAEVAFFNDGCKQLSEEGVDNLAEIRIGRLLRTHVLNLAATSPSFKPEYRVTIISAGTMQFAKVTEHTGCRYIFNDLSGSPKEFMLMLHPPLLSSGGITDAEVPTGRTE